MVLATGHISPAEMEPVVKAAREAKVERIVITHAEFPTTYLTVEAHKKLLPYGVYFERCFTTPYTGKVAWETVIENIRSVGAATTIVSTDLGQTTNPYVDEGLEIYIGKLLDAEISERDVERMVRDNPAQVLGVEARQLAVGSRAEASLDTGNTSERR
jgi:hypothetical protein